VGTGRYLRNSRAASQPLRFESVVLRTALDISNCHWERLKIYNYGVSQIAYRLAICPEPRLTSGALVFTVSRRSEATRWRFFRSAHSPSYSS